MLRDLQNLSRLVFFYNWLLCTLNEIIIRNILKSNFLDINWHSCRQKLHCIKLKAEIYIFFQNVTFFGKILTIRLLISNNFETSNYFEPNSIQRAQFFVQFPNFYF